MKPKLFTVLKNYSKEQFIKDFIAGLIVAIVALPLSIALAIASGVSPECGLYTAVFAGFFISFLGGSNVQIGGPTAAFVIIVYNIQAKYGMSGLTLAAIMAGIILIIMGFLKIGNLIKFIPATITTGFTAGIAVSIFAQQLKDFFGLKLERSPEDFIDRIQLYVKDFGTMNTNALIIGCIALLILILWPKVTNVIPGSLVAVIVTTILVKVTKLDVATIGSLYTVSGGIPKPQLPAGVDFKTIKELISPAVTIAILAGIESLLSCVVSDGMIGTKHDSNMELIGQGVGNIASALFGGIPATGAIARTATNIKSGGRTPVAGIVHSFTLLLILIFLMPLAELIPMATLAAILMVVAYNMSDWRTFKSMLDAPKSDIIVLFVTFLLTVVFDLVVAIEVGMVITAFLFINRMANETDIKYVHYNKKADDSDEIENDPDAISLRIIPKRVSVFEINGPMFFGAADKFTNILYEVSPDTKVIILRMRSVPSADETAFKTLKKIHEQCAATNMVLILSHVNSQPMKMLKKHNYDTVIGFENICPHIDDALDRARAVLN
ncbi:MAG: sulfate permease [Lachnospiraceae bacterium]|nr:sulfate permease [Lachnospiraceae bacterium]